MRRSSRPADKAPGSAGLAAFIIAVLFFTPTAVRGKDLVISMARHPRSVETAETGTFVDLVKAMDEVYTQGTIKIEVFPLARSIANLVKGRADFHLPAFRDQEMPEHLPYRYSTVTLGQVVFVYYTNAEDPFTLEAVRDSSRTHRNLYRIEVGRGTENKFDFPVDTANTLEQSLMKLSRRHIAGCIWAQEDADSFIRAKKLFNLKRTYYQTFDDVFLIPKGPRGDAMDALLTDIIEHLRKTGQLEALYQRIHKPYEDWQPYLIK